MYLGGQVDVYVQGCRIYLPRCIQHFIWNREQKAPISAEKRKSLRLVVLHTCTCRVISHLYRNKLDVAKKGKGGPRGEGPGGSSGRRGSSSGSSSRAPFRGVSLRYNKVQFYCRSASRERALSLPISDKIIIMIIIGENNETVQTQIVTRTIRNK